MIKLISNKIKCADNITNRISVQSKLLRKGNGTYWEATGQNDYYEIKDDDLMFVKLTFNNFQLNEVIDNLKMLIEVEYSSGAFLKVIKCQNTDLENVIAIAEQIAATDEFSDSLQITNYENKNLYLDLSNITGEITVDNDSLMFAIKFKKNGLLRIVKPNKLAEYVESTIAVVTEVCGTSSLYKFDENDFGNNGNVRINLFDGTPHYSVHLFSTPGKRMPISLSLFHNPNSSKLYDHFPFGIVPSFYYEAFENIGLAKIKGPTGDYTVYRRLELPSDAAEKDDFLKGLGIKEISNYKGIYYSDIDNSYLFTLTENSIDKIEAHDKNGNVMIFERNSSYRLKEIRNSLGHWIRFTWNGNKLNKLQNIDGEEMIFSYSGDYLSKVQIPSLFRCYCFDYSTANTIKISENDYTLSTSNVETISLIKYTRLVFFNYKKLRQVFDENNYSLQMDYVAGTDKVANITLFSYNGEKKYKTNYTYFDKCTMVKDIEDNKLYYYFDNLGRCVTIMDDEGRTVSYNFDKSDNGLSRNLTSQSRLQTNAMNLLDNHSFERNVDIDTNSLSWRKDSNTTAVIEDGGVYGGKCLSITGDSSNLSSVSQAICNPTSGTYKLRAFLKHEDLSDEDLSKIKIGFECIYRKPINGGEVPFYPNGGVTPEATVNANDKIVRMQDYCIIKNNGGNWYEISTSCTIPSTANDIVLNAVIELNMLNKTIYVDEVEVCKTNYNIRNNLIENGCFNYFQDNIPKVWNTENLCTGDGIVTNSLSDEHSVILGEYTFKFGTKKVEFESDNSVVPKKRKLFQQINISGVSNDEFVYSVYGKAKVTDNTIFRSFLTFNYADGTKDTFDFNFDKHMDNWQMLTRGVIAKKNFNSIIVGVEYDGSVDAFIDSFALYKDTFGTTYYYDKFGNILEILSSGNNSSLMTYTADNKLDTFSSSNGTFFRYIYDDKGRLSKIEDLKGNVCEYTYDNIDQITKQTLITSEGSVITNSTTYDNTNKTETYTDEFFKEIVCVKDYLYRVTSQKYNNQLENRYQYNGKSQLTKLSGMLSNLDYASNNIEYDNLGNISKLFSNNGTQYEFSYDKFGNITQVKCCGEVLQTNTYSPLDSNTYSKKLLLSSQMGGGDTYNFVYDNENRLSEIKINDTILCEYQYDEDGKVLKISDKTLNKDFHYSYDLSGNVENVYTEDGNSYKYNYDNLNNIQKAIYKINRKYRSVDYQYNYDMNEYTPEGFINTFAERKNEDVVVGFDLDKGLYGLKSVAKNVTVQYDSEYNIRIAKFDKTNSTIVFDLSTCNETRKWKEPKGILNSWEDHFNINKEFFMWIKPQNSYAQQDIFVLENVANSNDEYVNPSALAKIRVLDDGRLAYYSCLSKTNVIVSSDKITLNKWNFVGFHVQKDLSGNDAGYLILNDNINGETISENVRAITHIAIAKSGYNNPSTGTSLTMPFDFAFMSVGAEWSSNDDIKLLYRESKRLMFSGQKDQSKAIIYYDDELYKDFDVITLNGSLESTKGLRPVSICESTRKTDHLNRRIFKYDPLTKKQVLGVYSSEFEMSLDGSIKLGYDLNLDSSGTISLWFKSDDSTLLWGERTLITFSKSIINKFGVYINPGLSLSYLINDTKYDTTTFVSLDKWHHLGISFKYRQIIITLDGEKVVDVDKTISLDNTTAYIGTNINNAGGEANAYFEMFAYNRLYSDEQLLKTLAEKGQSTIVRDNFDSIGRQVSKETYASGNNYCVNYTYNKTRVTKEEDSSGETTQYGYSNNYGILGQIVHKKGDQVIYKEQVGYDKLLRVISETDELGGSHTYTYDKNGNMLRHVCVRNGIRSDLQYTYDSTIKDKLLSVADSYNVNNNIIIDYSSTNKFLPVKIRNANGSTKNLSWQGKRLISITGSSIINYVYNAQGLRTSKTVNGDTTSYLYEGTKVIQMTKNVGENQYVIDFVYDANGMLIGLNTQEGQYFYRRDITGNIVGILDSKGAYVVRYRYDAWGNLLYGTPLTQCIAANHNPFIYKGYMYDEETGWYYLQSRYYVPSLCRFLSLDSIDYAAPEIIGGLNLYAYCNNDPINYCDPSGHYIDTILDMAFILWDIWDLCQEDGIKKWENWVSLGVDVIFAVIPFATGGGGQVVKIANVADDINDLRKVTIIGESMNRVQDTAMIIGHVDDLYDGFKAYDKLSSLGKGGKVLAEIGGKTSNIAWLYGKLRSGYKVVDIGIDIGRVNKLGKAARSSSYIVERIVLAIWQTRNIWKWIYHLWG